MKLVLRLFPLVAIMLTIPLDAAAQREVKGRVVDPAGAPVPYVSVQIGATNTISDDSGRFVIKAPASPVSLRFRRIGFRAGEVDLIAGGDTAIVVSLASLPLEQERAVVQGTAMFDCSSSAICASAALIARRGSRSGWSIMSQRKGLS
jgi:hypothetical protein